MSLELENFSLNEMIEKNKAEFQTVQKKNDEALCKLTKELSLVKSSLKSDFSAREQKFENGKNKRMEDKNKFQHCIVKKNYC